MCSSVVGGVVGEGCGTNIEMSLFNHQLIKCSRYMVFRSFFANGDCASTLNLNVQNQHRINVLLVWLKVVVVVCHALDQKDQYWYSSE